MSIEEPFVVNLFTTALLYGLYVAIFVLCLRWLIFADEGWVLRKNIDKMTVFAVIIIFLASTMNLSATFRLAMVADLDVMGSFLRIYGIGAINHMTLAMTIVIVDLVMIYRCWVVYSRSWRAILLPALLWFGCLISITLVFYYNHLVVTELKIPVDAFANFRRSVQFHLAFYVATNLYTTTAIIYRIWRVVNEGNGTSSCRLKSLCYILAVTGLIYAASAIVFLVGYSLDTGFRTLDLVTSAIYFMMTCILFNIVPIGVAQNRVKAEEGSMIQTPRQ